MAIWHSTCILFCLLYTSHFALPHSLIDIFPYSSIPFLGAVPIYASRFNVVELRIANLAGGAFLNHIRHIVEYKRIFYVPSMPMWRMFPLATAVYSRFTIDVSRRRRLSTSHFALQNSPIDLFTYSPSSGLFTSHFSLPTSHFSSGSSDLASQHYKQMLLQ